MSNGPQVTRSRLKANQVCPACGNALHIPQREKNEQYTPLHDHWIMKLQPVVGYKRVAILMGTTAESVRSRVRKLNGGRLKP